MSLAAGIRRDKKLVSCMDPITRGSVSFRERYPVTVNCVWRFLAALCGGLLIQRVSSLVASLRMQKGVFGFAPTIFWHYGVSYANDDLSHNY